MRKQKFLTVSIILVMLLSLAGQSIAVSARPLGATTPALGTLTSVSILAATTVTNTGLSSTSGDVDISPGCALSDLGTLTIGGATNLCNAVSLQAQADAGTARSDMLSQASDGTVGPGLDGLTVVPGVYDMGAGLLSGGVVTLNGPGVYIFRASSSLTSSGSISLINGARACDVYWNVETLATINGTSFVGTIISGTGVHFGAGVTLDGRALARGGDVTLISDVIGGPSCPAPALPTNTPAPAPRRTRLPAAVSGLPNTGGAPIRNDDFPWRLLIVAAGFSAITLALGVRAHRRAHLPKQ